MLITKVIGTVIAILILTTGLSFAQKPPVMKMTTDIPPGITTPDDIETRLGTLNFFDGVPIGDTTEKVYNFLDFQHAYQAFMSGIQIASMDAIRKGILAKNWNLFASENLETFADNIYIILQKNHYLLPEKLQLILPRIILENWLVSYQRIEGIERTCRRLGKRIKRPKNCAIAHHDLQANYQELETGFVSFFPQLVKYINSNRHIF